MNVLTQSYSDLWNSLLDYLPTTDKFSHSLFDDSIFKKIITPWSKEIPLRTIIQRRQALIEIDVLVAMEVGLNLGELISIYQIQFPVLAANDNRLINNICQEDKSINELCKGLNYLNRVECYKTAWAHFEKVFAEEKQEQ